MLANLVQSGRAAVRSDNAAEPALDLRAAAEVRALAVDELRRAGLAVRRLLRALQPRPAAVGADLGSGRIVGSDIEAPNMLADLV